MSKASKITAFVILAVIGFVIAYVLFSIFLLDASDSDVNDSINHSEAQTMLNPGKSFYNMIKNLEFDGVEMEFPCKVSNLPQNFSLVDESHLQTGDRFEMRYNGKIAGFVITENHESKDDAIVAILTVDFEPHENSDDEFCVFKIDGLSFDGKTKSEIETLFSEYTYMGDSKLLVYSFTDGSVIFNFNDNGLCNFMVIGAAVSKTDS